MIDESTQNKNYPLPHPSNIASQDVTRIATALTMIDADISECSDSINSINNTVQNLDATGFSTVEGGGGEGGKKVNSS